MILFPELLFTPSFDMLICQMLLYYDIILCVSVRWGQRNSREGVLV